MTIHWIMIVIVAVIICNESMYISSCLVLSCLESTSISISIVIIGMTLYELVLHYHIISYYIIPYLMFVYFISSADLIFIVFYSILLYFKLIGHVSTLFDSILLNLIYYIVQYCISYQWMICVCLSVYQFVCGFICMNKFYSFISSLLFFFSLYSFLFSWLFFSHTHSHTHGHTHMYKWIYVPSYDSYILLQKFVRKVSYSSDCIISYLI